MVFYCNGVSFDVHPRDYRGRVADAEYLNEFFSRPH